MLSVALVRTAPLYERVRHIIPSIERPLFGDDIDASRNAVILAHNYQSRRSSTAWLTSSVTALRWHGRR
jgi:hypothetical protein